MTKQRHASNNKQHHGQGQQPRIIGVRLKLTLSLIGTVGNLGRTVSTTFSEQCSSVDVHRSRMIEPTADVAEFIGRFPASVAMPLTAQLGIPRRRF